MARFYLRSFILLMVFALALTACGPSAAPTEAMPEEPQASEPVEEQPTAEAPAETEALPAESGGTIVVALAAAPVTLDPADHRSRESETVIRNMFDGLVTRDNTSGVHLQLAESMNW